MSEMERSGIGLARRRNSFGSACIFPWVFFYFIIGRQPVSEMEHVRSFDTKKNIAEKSNFL